MWAPLSTARPRHGCFAHVDVTVALLGVAFAITQSIADSVFGTLGEARRSGVSSRKSGVKEERGTRGDECLEFGGLVKLGS